MAILVVAAAFVVDIGMARATRADVQSVADVVALDLAREIKNGKTQAQLAADGDWNNPSSAVRRSAARNASALGHDLTMSVDWGSFGAAGWDTTTDPPTAVEVTVRSTSSHVFATGSATVGRSAVAVASSTACYKLGSFVAAVNSGDSSVLAPLNDLFGVSLDLVSYKALAASKIRLSDLAADPTIGSPQALLTGTIAYGTLVQAMITVLSKDSANAVAVTALGKILQASSGFGSVNLGSVLHVAPSDTAALDVAFNVLDIIGSARMSNGSHFISIPNIQAGVPGVGFQFTGDLALISAAQQACGAPNSVDSHAHNSQLEGNIAVDFANLPSLNTAVLGTLQTAKASGLISVHIGNADGQLISPPAIHCGTGTAADPHAMTISVASLLSSYYLDIDVDVNGSIKTDLLQSLGLGGLLNNLLGILLPAKVDITTRVHLKFGTTALPNTSTVTVKLPPNDVTPVQTGTSVYLDPNSVVPSVSSVTVAGSAVPVANVTALTDPIVQALTTNSNDFVAKTLTPLIDNLNNVLIGPVAKMIGLRFGGADVYAVSAACGVPSLRR